MKTIGFLPKIETVDLTSLCEKRQRLLIASEGFEERSISFLSQKLEVFFSEAIICKYHPPKESKYDILLNLTKKYCSVKTIKEATFDRFEPFIFEKDIYDYLLDSLEKFEEIVIDISVMSKYMIMQLLCLLKAYTGTLRIIYTEPQHYAPLEASEFIDEQNNATQLPSVGVQNIVKTPLLTSLIMQQSPSLLVSFLSFNEQLIRALLSECTPARVLLINGVPPHLPWREKAMNDIHRGIIKEYCHDNPIDEKGMLYRKCSTLFYDETIDLLATIYKEFGEDYRIILSPTGSKMQAVGSSLIKNCCEDIHIEYPTPESYYIDGYSSSEIREIHQILFSNYNSYIQKLSAGYGLNG